MSIVEQSAPMYSIGDVAERTGVSVDTLRYYEKAGLMPGVARDRSGRRSYSEDDCGWIVFVRRLRATAMPASEIARYAELVRHDAGTSAQRREVLVRHRDRVLEAQAALSAAVRIVDRKIKHYDAAERGIDVGGSEVPINSVRLVEP